MSRWGRWAAAGCVVIALLLLVAFMGDLPPFAASPDEPADFDVADESEAPSPRPAPGDEPPPERLGPPPPPDEPDEPDESDVPEETERPEGVGAPPVVPQPAVVVDPSAVEFTGKAIMKATDKAVAWLRKKQARSGSWGSVQGGEAYGADRGSYPAGPTALAVYTLIKAKVPIKDPSIKRGFSSLEKNFEKPRTSYETSMLLLAVTATADVHRTGRSAKRAPRRPKVSGKYRAWAKKLVDHLVEKRSALGWRYDNPEQPTLAGGPQDLSSTQLAALALLSAHRVGIKVKAQVWEDILRFTLDQQELDGPTVAFFLPAQGSVPGTAEARGFTYVKMVDVPDRGAPTGGMTACGVANLLMAKHVLSDEGRQILRWSRRPDAEAVGLAIVDGCAWLDAHWSPFADPGKGEVQVSHPYYLWMLECVMDLAGLQHLGRHAWYAEAGRELLARQRPDGSWLTKGSWEPADVLDTAFALLFLRRAARFLIEHK